MQVDDQEPGPRPAIGSEAASMDDGEVRLGQRRVDALHAVVEQLFRDEPELWQREPQRAETDFGNEDHLAPAIDDRQETYDARKRLSAAKKWIIGSCIVGGVATLQFAGFGLIPIGVGLWIRLAADKRQKVETKAGAFPLSRQCSLVRMPRRL